VVLLDRDVFPYPERSSYDLIGIDNRRAGYVATSDLVGAGCKRLIFVGKHRSAPSCVARGVGFRDALHDAGIECRADFVRHQTDPASEDEVGRIMSDLRPDGIVCSNDFTAAQLMKTLEQLSISVPDDVKMVGFDDVKQPSFGAPDDHSSALRRHGRCSNQNHGGPAARSDAPLARHSAELWPRCA
jgi:GntR family transcriptional regulator of arabinose operon